jgi:DNA polymerase-3 subunit epsilon
MDFVAIDVETANADMASICSIGAARFEGGKIVDEWYSLIDPRDYFDGINVSIHGIDELTVRGAPTYDEVAATLHAMLRGAVTVTHTHFDRVATQQASGRWGVSAPDCRWLDSARVARRAWSECAKSGYGLANVCRLIGYKFEHHNALEDAKAAGHVLLAAIDRTGLDIDGWLSRVAQPINPASGSSGAAIRRAGNADGPLFGEVVVFTGALAIPRREAADLAASLGCVVETGVTKKTTLLVVGDTDVMRLAGHEKSSKHRKAEELASKGFPIRILRETDFRELVALA